jgi:hypothetical protein
LFSGYQPNHTKEATPPVGILTKKPVRIIYLFKYIINLFVFTLVLITLAQTLHAEAISDLGIKLGLIVDSVVGVLVSI